MNPPSRSHRYTTDKYPGPVYSDFLVFTPCYAHIYCVPGYTFHPLPGQHPQSRSSNWEPTDDGHCTIPSNGELLPEHPVTSTFDHLGLYNLLNDLEDMIRPQPTHFYRSRATRLCLLSSIR